MRSFNNLPTVFGLVALTNSVLMKSTLATPAVAGGTSNPHHPARYPTHFNGRFHPRQATTPSVDGNTELVPRNPQDNEAYTPFAILFPSIAMSQQAETPLATPPIANPASDAPASSVSPPTVTSSIYLGPGPVVPSSSASSPTTDSIDAIDPEHVSVAPSSTTQHKHLYPVPIHKLVIVVGVVAGFCFLMLLLMVLAELRAARLARRLMKKEALLASARSAPERQHPLPPPSRSAPSSSSSSTSTASITEDKMLEKPVGLGIAPLIKFPPALANRTAANLNEKPAVSIVRSHHRHGHGHRSRKNKAANVNMGHAIGMGTTANIGEYPRSKFSVTSSDYPYSLQSSYPSTSSTSTSDSVEEPPSASSSSSGLGHQQQHQVPVFVVEDSVSPSQPLTPAEFFAMPQPNKAGDVRMISQPQVQQQQQVQGQQLTRSNSGMGSTTSFQQRLRTRPPSLSPIKEELGRNEMIAGSLNVHNGYNYGKPRNA
ncbi:hypothetical protein AX16_002608 [Volvariella volvacea WC 439]|nr:hypothetical protein AX16_002608 [Volvariella volvacea WC 439]